MPGGGKALLFEHVLLHDGARSPYPVAINLFGSMRRMALALGCALVLSAAYRRGKRDARSAER